MQKEVTAPIGEILYSYFVFIGIIFLNRGALRFVRRIGISAIDNKSDIKTKGSNFIGLLKFNKRAPNAIEPKVINI